MKVRVSEQILTFIQNQAPEPRGLIRRAIRELANEEGDILPLEDRLSGYFRLRAGRFRIIFRYSLNGIDCIYIEDRSIVYEVFESRLRDRLSR